MKFILFILLYLLVNPVTGQTIQRPVVISGAGNLGEDVFELGSYEELDRPGGEISELNYGRLRLTRIFENQPGNILSFQNWDIISGNLGLEFQVEENPVGYISSISGEYSAISDASMKTNVSPCFGVLDRVLHLSPKSYTFVDDSTGKTRIGFISQELEELFPEFVSDLDGLKLINYAGLSTIAIQAIKEQNEIIRKLVEKVDKLQSDLAAIKKDNASVDEN